MKAAGNMLAWAWRVEEPGAHISRYRHVSCQGIVADAIETSLTAHKNKVPTLTMDNGLEFAKHISFGKTLQADTYFAHPTMHGSGG